MNKNISDLVNHARSLVAEKKYSEAIDEFNMLYCNYSLADNVVREFAKLMLEQKNKSQQELGFSILKNVADKGGLIECGLVARCYRKGVGVTKNLELCIKYYTKGQSINWIKKELVEVLIYNSTFDNIKSIDNIESIFDRKEKKYINADLSIEDGTLVLLLQDNNIKFSFKIYKDEEEIFSGSFNTDKFLYKIENDGTYYITGKNEICNKYFVSKKVSYFDFNIRNNYEKYKRRNFNVKPFDFYESNYPFYDFIVTNYDDSSFDIGFKYNIEKNIIYSNKELKDNCIFSGYFHDKDKFYYGDEDVSSKQLKRTDLFNKTGCFTNLFIKNKNIYLGSDVFGFGKLYYYIGKDKKYVVSNRYHLLLIYASRFDKTLSIDDDKVSYLLSLSYGMLSDQFIDNSCLVKNTSIIDISEFILISKDGTFSICANNFLTLESNNDYKKNIERTINEIQDNFKGVFNNPRFNLFVQDLTGGLDSRVLFSVLTMFDNSNHYVEMLTGGAIRDVECAASIAQKYKYKYSREYPMFRKLKNGYSSELQQLSIDEYINLFMSFEIGTSFDHSNLFSCGKYDNLMHITGGAGECCTRPYMSKRFFNINKASTIESLINNYKEEIIKNICLSSSRVDTMFDVLEKYFKSSNCNLCEKSEDLLYKYRNRFHFDPMLKNMFSNPIIMPLQSVNGYKCLRKSLNCNNISYQFVFDILNSIDGDLSCCEFESFKDNVCSAIFSKNNFLIKHVGKTDDYKDSILNNESIFLVKKSTDYIKINIGEESLYDHLLEELFILLGLCLKCELLNDIDGIDLYYLFVKLRKNKDRSIIVGMFKKLHSIIYTYQIISCNHDFKVKKFTPKVFKKTINSNIFFEL